MGGKVHGSTELERANHHVESALRTDDIEDMDYHIRQAIQLLTLD